MKKIILLLALVAMQTSLAEKAGCCIWVAPVYNQSGYLGWDEGRRIWVKDKPPDRTVHYCMDYLGNGQTSTMKWSDVGTFDKCLNYQIGKYKGLWLGGKYQLCPAKWNPKTKHYEVVRSQQEVQGIVNDFFRKVITNFCKQCPGDLPKDCRQRLNAQLSSLSLEEITKTHLDNNSLWKYCARYSPPSGGSNNYDDDRSDTMGAA